MSAPGSRDHNDPGAYFSLGDYRRAIDFYRQNVTYLTGDSARERLVGRPACRPQPELVGLVPCRSGRVRRGDRMGRGRRWIAEKVNHPWALVSRLWRSWGISLRHGDLSNAIPVLERGLRLCQSAQISLFFPRLASALGLAYAQSGRLAEGLPLLAQAVEQSAAMQIVLHHALWIIHLGEGHRLAGRLDEAAHGAMRASSWRALTRNEATRPMLCASSARSPRIETPRRSSPAKRTTARPWRSPKSWACARWWLTASSGSAGSTGARAAADRPGSSLPRRRRCTARWICGAGSSRPT